VDTAELVTARLLLRDLRREDWEGVHRYAADPVVTRYLRWGPNSEAQTRTFVEAAIRHAAERPRRSFELAIVWRATGELIGGCGLLGADADGEYEIGYCLRPSWWSRGIGAESVRALLELGFGALGARGIYACVDPANAASTRLLEAAGFRHARRLGRGVRLRALRRDPQRHGLRRASLVYVILAGEWRAANAP
jgi:ribosomal-protein-alanine N-acetyltransferase